jgi:phosphoribosyl 1,2-cyclic phosphodiesterase
VSGDRRAARDAPRAMQVRFWGTRGSIPSPGPDTVRYGGNTPCVTVSVHAYPPLIFDAGTGIRVLGDTLDAKVPDEPLDLFLSHTHWDHIQGLPFFAPLFRQGLRLRIWGVDDPPGSLERTIRGLMSPEVFPVDFDQVGATIEFRPPPFEGTVLHGLSVRALAVHHPGGAVGYRIDDRAGHAVIYVPDNELRGGAPDVAALREPLIEACRGASLLIHDSTYTEAESADFSGWGHSTTDDALQLAIDAGVGTLVLFHHAPHRTDAEVDALVAHCEARARGLGAEIRILAAAEGLVLGGTGGNDP